MPGYDRTGPSGLGPLTGRGLGPCSRGLAFRGFGRGFGFRRWQGFPATEQVTLTEEEQRKVLEAELKEIEAEKQEIEKKLNELKT